MTTTPCAIRRLELLLARTPDMECADDLRVVLADAVLSRRLLEGETEAHLAVTRQLAVAESKLADARRLLDDARAQKPVAYMHNKRVDVIHTSVKSLLSDFAVNSGPESMLRPIDKSEHYTIPLYAAPVPAQPAAVPLEIAGDIRPDDYVSPRLRAELGIPSHIAELATNIRRNLRHMRGTSDDSVTLDFIDHIDTIAQQIESDAGKPAAVPEAVAKDAARYRWLRSANVGDAKIWDVCDGPACLKEEYRLDDAIDAALLSAADTEVKK